MKRIEMSNKKYGSLTVLKFMDNGKVGARWKCVCDCGKIKVVDGYLLRRGSVKTCGCKIGFKNDLSGKRFGNLVASKEAGRSKSRHILWECRCDCGNVIITKSRYLTHGETQSCGCLQKLKYREAAKRKLYKSYINNAKERKVKFSLTEDEFFKLTSSKCYYCGVEPYQISKKGNNGTYIYNGLDRVDNIFGYTKENVRPCCFNCNRSKWNMSEKEFIIWINRLCSNQFSIATK